jgi:hypothetical protein
MNAVDSFRIDVPASWQELPLDLPSLRASLQERSGDEWDRLDPVDRRRIDLYLQRLLVDIESVDARFVAVFSEVITDEDGAAGDVPLVAACVVSVLGRDGMGSELPLTPAVVQAAMSLSRDEEAPVLAGVRSTNLAEPAIVELPHAAAVLVRRLVEVRQRGSESAAIATETYFLSVADRYEQLVVAQFSTPNLADASLLSELFAEIAATVRFYREGEETVL